MAEVYDLYLIGVLELLCLDGVTTRHSAVALYHGLRGASLVASVLIADMLFRNPPTEPSLHVGTSLGYVSAGWALTLIFL